MVLKYVLMYCQRNGAKRSQRRVTERRRKSEDIRQEMERG